MSVIQGSPKKTEYVQLLQIESVAKEGWGERQGERERSFKELVYMLWEPASQISPGQYREAGSGKLQCLYLKDNGLAEGHSYG